MKQGWANLRLSIADFFSRGPARSVKIKRNVVALGFLKIASMVAGFLLVPLALGYLDSKASYGIWLTLSSIVTWLGFFDIGLGNGLRNKLGEALAKNDREKARIWISTTLAMLTTIGAAIFALFTVVALLLDWPAVMNAPAEMGAELRVLAIVTAGLFSIRFAAGVITIILSTDQRPAMSELLNVLVNVIALGIIFVLTRTTHGSLLYLGIALSGMGALVPAVASFWFFARDYRDIAPSLRHVDWPRVTELAGHGFQFFAIQISALVLFGTSNIVITQLFGPEEVVPYNLAHRIFSQVIMVFGIVTAPFWAAYTDAWHRGDKEWIRGTTAKVVKLWCVIAAGLPVLVALSNTIYRLWVGASITVPLWVSGFMALYVAIHCWNIIFVTFAFGVGKVRLLLYSSIVGAAVNVPLSILFSKHLGLGPAGVILATAACMLPSSFIQWIQYRKLMNGTATGIWDR